MSQISFVLLIIGSFLLTVYCGVAAWRITAAQSVDITGQIIPSELNGWQRPLRHP